VTSGTWTTPIHGRADEPEREKAPTLPPEIGGRSTLAELGFNLRCGAGHRSRARRSEAWVGTPCGVGDCEAKLEAV
jgi:hypothetical protein